MSAHLHAHSREFLHTIEIELTTDLISKFWLSIEKSSDSTTCWRWIGPKTDQGYGRVSAGKTDYRAHRVSWVIHNGRIPYGYVICHSCDNPECTNPSHLFIGTVIDNNADAIAKGRLQNQRYLVSPLSATDYRALLAQMIRDRMRTRQTRGLRKGCASTESKLSESQVHKICQLLTLGAGTMRSIGAQFGVTNQCVHAIKSGRIWRQIGLQYGFTRKGV